MNADMLARDGIWVLFGLLGGMNINGPLLGLLLSKRGQIRASTLMSRSNEYKAKLVSKVKSVKQDAPYQY
jgi:tumor protein p53-inducible protein 3